MLTCWRLAAAGILALGLSSATVADGPYRGRPLVEVLREFEAGGLELVYTSAVVSGDLLVTLEPAAEDARAQLLQILEPLGLSVAEGPVGSLVIVPAAENPGTVRGRIVAAEGGHRIPQAQVTLVGSVSIAQTDRRGLFKLSGVPPGAHSLEVRAAGFRVATVDCPTLSPGDSVFVLVELPFESSFVQQVRVTPGEHILEREAASPQYSITHSDALAAPSTSGDAARMVEFLPGVAAPDNSARFQLRGSNQHDSSIVLDGLELYEPVHLDQFQSPFSLVDSNAVERIDVRAGGFTAEFGDRHGGFVEITSLNPTERSGALELGSLNTRFTYQTPFAERSGSALFSGRAWYPDHFWNATELGGAENIQPQLQDLYAKTTFRVSSRFAWSAHLLFGHDTMRFQETGQPQNESARADTSNLSGWIRGLGRLGKNIRSETILSLGVIDKERSGVSSTQASPLELVDTRDVGFAGLRHDMTWKPHERAWIKGGVDVRWLRAEYDYRIGPMNDPQAAEVIRIDPRGTSLGAYTAYRRAFSDKIAAEFGLRWDRQSYTEDNQLSPRFNATWRPDGRTELRLALGRYQQSQRIHELSVEDGETTFGAAEASEQIELSYEHTLSPTALRFRVDAYYRRLTRLRPRFENLFEPVEIFPETAPDRVTIDPQRATLSGLELFLKSPAGGAFNWWTSYTYATAQDHVDGADIPRSWDQRHAFKFLVGYRSPRSWSVALSGVLRSGWPTTPVSGERALVDGMLEDELILGPRNSDRLRDYVRFDARVRRGFATRRGDTVWLSFDIANLTDRKNPCCVADFVFGAGPPGPVDVTVEYDSWLGIRPSFSVLWEF